PAFSSLSLHDALPILPDVRRRHRRPPHRGQGMTAALTEIRTAPGLDAYLDKLEGRLERAVEAYPGVVAAVGKESLAAGGKRLRRSEEHTSELQSLAYL